jgi:ketosteroid isomerase-like protein
MTAIDEILEQEEQLAHAKRALDLEAIDRIYADDLLLTGVLGEPTCSKNAVMDEIRRGIAQRDGAKAGGASFESSTANEDTKVVTLGDTAVANYRFVVTVKGPNLDFRRRYRTTNVWAKRWPLADRRRANRIRARSAAGGDALGGTEITVGPAPKE